MAFEFWDNNTHCHISQIEKKSFETFIGFALTKAKIVKIKKFKYFFPIMQKLCILFVMPNI